MKKLLFILVLCTTVSFSQDWLKALDNPLRDSTLGDGTVQKVTKDFKKIAASSLAAGGATTQDISDSLAANLIPTNGIAGKVAVWITPDSLGSVYTMDTSASGGAMTKQAILDTMSHTYVRHNYSKYVELFDDFAGGLPTTSGSFIFQQSVSGTGAAINKNTAPPDSTWFGTITATTGTTNTGYANANTTPDGVVFGNGEIYFETRVRIPVLSTTGGAGESFCIDAGFLDKQDASEPTDGAFFRYDSTHADWRIILRSNATIDTTNVTGVTVAANTNYKLGISVNAYTATFWINGTQVGSVNSSAVPNGTLRALGNVIRIYKKSLATARTMLVDYFFQSKTFTATR